MSDSVPHPKSFPMLYVSFEEARFVLQPSIPVPACLGALIQETTARLRSSSGLPARQNTPGQPRPARMVAEACGLQAAVASLPPLLSRNERLDVVRRLRKQTLIDELGRSQVRGIIRLSDLGIRAAEFHKR